MIPPDWTPHRRDDGELIGWISVGRRPKPSTRIPLPWPALAALRPRRPDDPDGRLFG
ncbi:hypothetical protein QSU92_10910 [Microbacterium sp. ET2]|uniref:hypothetical protein n=1 Tax=Microbacterium albipurpureum TaxID=3050384 RepID=UPI00259C8926|nr:hypothetical protein [Microbacterium sp. ET2 (Ac-2212)]WJL94482.1 hypothetical protein QSU92_10910 [Microbacterium sp. ET2 (Ac-2212)]